MLQLTDYMKLNKKEDQSVVLWSYLEGKQNNHRRGREGPRRERRGRKKQEGQDQVWEETGEKYRESGN